MENNSAGEFLFYIDDSRKNQSACYLVFPALLTPLIESGTQIAQFISNILPVDLQT